MLPRTVVQSSRRLRRNVVAAVSVGVLFGIFYVFHNLERQSVPVPAQREPTFTLLHLKQSNSVEKSTTIEGEAKTSNEPDHNRGEEIGDPHTYPENMTGPSNEVSESVSDEGMHRGAETEAQMLAKKVRVLCWVMTTSANHKKKAIHVKQTWGKRCSKLLFMSDADDSELPSIGLQNTKVGRNYLWGKTKEAFKHIYQHYLDEADWFMKADDDTFVILENLRFMLKDYDTNYPIYFGCKFKPFTKQGYMSGGAGYVLSKEALKKFVEEALPNKKKCRRENNGAEDAHMGICLENIGVEAGDSRDEYGRHRFLPFAPDYHIFPGRLSATEWFWKYTYYPQKEGVECCSNTAVSFHFVTPKQMQELDFFIYHLRPYGIGILTNPSRQEKGDPTEPTTTSHPSSNQPQTSKVMMAQSPA